MDLGDTKAVIRSLVTSTKSTYNIRTLLIDFEAETGYKMPTYQFKDVTEFLKSLKDTIEIRGQPPTDQIRVVKSEKSLHIASLVKREAKCRTQCRSYSRRMISREEHLENRTGTNYISHNPATPTCSSNDSSHTNRGRSVNKPKSQVEHSVVKEKKKKNKQKSKNDFKDSVPLSEKSKTSVNSIYDSIGEKLKVLMKLQPRGIWCSQLPDLYNKHFNSPLDYKELGCRSLMEMVLLYMGVFRCVRPGKGDWMLFDATKPVSKKEKGMLLRARQKLSNAVKENIIRLIKDYEKSSGQMLFENFRSSYFLKYKEELRIEEYGFRDLFCFLTSLDGSTLRFYKEDKKWVIKLMEEEGSTKTQGSALPPITADAFNDLFWNDVAGPKDVIPRLDLKKYIQIGEKNDVCVGAVWSVEQFFLTLGKFKYTLDNLTDMLQEFYSNTTSYKMPDKMILPNQICVAACSLDRDGPMEWHRTVIKRVVDHEKVTVSVVDFGADITLEKKNLRFLHRDFFGIPAQAFRGVLHDVSLSDDRAKSDLASKRFLALVSAPCMEMFVVHADFEESYVCGVLFMLCGNKRISINERLVEEGLAVYKSLDTCSLSRSCWTSSSRIDTDSHKNTGPANETVSPKNKRGIEAQSDSTNVKKNHTPSTENETLVGSPRIKSQVGEVKSELKAEYEAIQQITEETVVPTFDNREQISLCHNNSNGSDKYLKYTFPTNFEYKTRTEIFALAYHILCTVEWVRDIARLNLDHGLNIARSLATETFHKRPDNNFGKS